MFPPNLRFYGASAAPARTLERPSGSPSANVPFEAKLLRRIVGIADSHFQRLGSAFGYPLGLSASALKSFAFSAVTRYESPAIKSASFPMALLHGFLDRHPLRRKHQYYIKISAPRGARKGEPGFSQVAARLVNAPTAAQGRRQFGRTRAPPKQPVPSLRSLS